MTTSSSTPPPPPCVSQRYVTLKLLEIYGKDGVKWRDIQNGTQARVAKAFINVFTNGTVQVQGAQLSPEYRTLSQVKETCDTTPTAELVKTVETMVSSSEKAEGGRVVEPPREPTRIPSSFSAAHDASVQEAIDRKLALLETSLILTEHYKTVPALERRLKRIETALRKSEKRYQRERARLQAVTETVERLMRERKTEGSTA